MQLAIAKTAGVVGLSSTTVQTVIETYNSLADPADYRCPYCSKEYKTGRGFRTHLMKVHKDV